MYPAMSNKIIPREWTHYSAEITGEVFKISNTQFRKGTKSVKLGFLANYQQQG